MIGKVTRVGLLYDIYGGLLTPRQRQVIELYYFDDWSLAEVADAVHVSRQAVHDNLRRAEELLESYESQLQVLDARQKRQESLDMLISLWHRVRHFVPEEEKCELESAIQALEQQV